MSWFPGQATGTTGVVGPTVQVMGYYPGWRNFVLPPEDLDFTSMTHVIAFSTYPDSVANDGTLDRSFFQGSNAAGVAWVSDIAMRAHAAGKKCLICLGGAGYRDEILGALSTTTKRDTFIADLIDLVADTGADGIDFDWEPVNHDAGDFTPYLDLVQRVRAAGPSLILTAAVPGAINSSNPATEVTGAHAFWTALADELDYVNIMAYGIAFNYEGWDSWHTSPIFNHSATTPTSVSYSVAAYQAAGVPASKIGIGSTFEAQAWGPNVTGPKQSMASNTTEDVWSIADIEAYAYTAGRWRWDPVAKGEYLAISPAIQINGTGGNASFVSYDAETAINAKAHFIADEGLASYIIWDFPQARASLLAYAYDQMQDPDDIEPTGVSFTDVTDATVSTSYESNLITLGGIDATVAIRISGGEYQKNGGSWVSTEGTAVSGDTFKVRRNSSGSSNTTVNVLFYAGQSTDTFSITTALPAGALDMLFTGSELGVWYDIHPDYLFSDTAGTTPASVNGSVRHVQDRSGNGFPLVTTNTFEAPLLKQDANGAYYLQWDAINDFMETATSPFGSSITAAHVCLAFREVTRTDAILFSLTGSLSSGEYWHVYPALTSDNALYFDIINGSGGANRITGPLGVTTGNAVVLTLQHDTSLQRVRVNGTQLGADTSGGTVTGAAKIRLGMIDSAYPFKLYGFVAVNNMTDAERTTVENYMTSRFTPATVLADEEFYSGGKYIAYASPWAASAEGLTHITDYEDTIEVYDTTFPDGSVINWRWPSTAPVSSGVYGYLALSYGEYDGGTPEVPVTPLQISGMDTFETTIDWSSSATSANYDCLLEFFTTTASGDSDTKAKEVGFFLHAPTAIQDYHNAGTNVGTWTDPQGRSWTCKIVVGGLPIDFITFMRSGGADLTSGVIDIKDALDFLVTNGQVNASHWVNGIALGVEPIKATGSLTINSWDVTFTAAGLGIPTQTNLLNQSINNAFWTADNVTTPSASSLRETTATGGHGVYNMDVTHSGASTYAIQVDAEAVGDRNFAINLWTSFFGAAFTQVFFDLANGVVDFSSSTSPWSIVSAEMSLLSTNKYRCRLTFNVVGTATGFTVTLKSTKNDTGNTESYAGETAKGLNLTNIYLWDTLE